MANVKFIKIKADSTSTVNYEEGAIYFDEKLKQIKLGQADGKFTAYGGTIADVKMGTGAQSDALIITYSDGRDPLTFDFSDIASASEIEKRLKALEAKAPVAGHDIKIGKLSKDDDVADNAINVALSSDILVAGGPLADDVLNDTWPSEWKNANNAKIIPAGKTLKEILEGLFLQVQNGTLTENYVWNPSIAAPTASLGSSTVVEVGKNITATFAPATAVSGNTSTVTISGTYGVFVDDKYREGSYSESKAGTTTGTAAASATIKLGSAAAIAATSGTAYAAAEGANVLSVTNSGVTAVPTAFTAKTVYASTNTKTKVTGTSKAVVTNKFSSKALTSTKSATVTAYYPIYVYGKTSSVSDTTASDATNTLTKLPLVANNTQFGVAFPAMVKGGNGYRILLASGKSVKTAKKLNPLTAKYDIDCTAQFKKSGTTTSQATGDTTANYYTWEYNGTDGPNRVVFTIG